MSGRSRVKSQETKNNKKYTISFQIRPTKFWPAKLFEKQIWPVTRKLYFYFFLFSCIFILLSRESDQCAVRVRLGVASHLLLHQDRGIALSAFPNGTTSELACWFLTCPFNAERQAGKL